MFDTITNLKLSNFSSLFEIAATLNLVFVVAEHAKQYGSTLTKNFFRSETDIEAKFEEIFSKVDKESVETMPAIVINNVSTESEIQEVKRNIHKLEESKAARINNFKKITDNRCVLTSFSFISLYMFLYSLTALYVEGLNETAFTKCFWATYTILSLMILCMLYVFGEKENPKWIKKTLSLTNCCVLFLLLIGISFLSVFYRLLAEPFSVYYWTITVPLSTLLPYLSFVVFLLIIKKRLMELSTTLKKELNDFAEECGKVDAHIHRLKEAYDLSVNMR